MISLSVAATSVLTPLGKDPLKVYNAVEAGINRYGESDVLDILGNPILLSLIPSSVIDSVINKQQCSQTSSARQRRLLRLSIVALKAIKASLPEESVPLFLAGPENNLPENSIDKDFFHKLCLQTDVDIDINNSKIANVGRAGALGMLTIASKYFNKTDKHYALIGGVDSYYDVSSLDFLDDNQRLLSDNNKDGFVPGEGAGFLLLISPRAPESIRLQTKAQLSVSTTKFETNNIFSGGKFLGEALSNAVGDLRETLSLEQKIEYIYSSSNGEHHYAKELSLVLLRHRDFFSDNKSLIRPAEYYGDLGAASALAQLCLAVEKVNQLQKSILVMAASDSGLRASTLVSASKAKN